MDHSQHSLSIVLPVYNAQQTLAAQVHGLLDVLPELTPRFEVLIVDDGSTDSTCELADDLARQFPQVKAARHGRHRGIPAAVQTGLARTTGEIIFVQDERTPLSSADLRRLWDLRGQSDIVMARALPRPVPLEPGLVSRLMAWGSAIARPTTAAGNASAGMQMIRRRAIEELRVAARPETELAVARHSRTDIVTRETAQSRPKFLKRLREFAAGE